MLLCLSVQGYDFYSCPRLNKKGDKLAYVACELLCTMRSCLD